MAQKWDKKDIEIRRDTKSLQTILLGVMFNL